MEANWVFSNKWSDVYDYPKMGEFGFVQLKLEWMCANDYVMLPPHIQLLSVKLKRSRCGLVTMGSKSELVESWGQNIDAWWWKSDCIWLSDIGLSWGAKEIAGALIHFHTISLWLKCEHWPEKQRFGFESSLLENHAILNLSIWRQWIH